MVGDPEVTAKKGRGNGAFFFLLFLLELAGFGCGTLLQAVAVCDTKPCVTAYRFRSLHCKYSETKGFDTSTG